MNKFWTTLGLLMFSLVMGIMPLLAILLLIAAVYAVIAGVAEAGLGRSIENAKAELQAQPDPDKAKALCGFVAKMEEHKALIHIASMGLVLSVLFIVKHPAILLVWLLWVVAWRAYAYACLRRA